MNKPINIKEFKALVKRYETITLQEIKDKWLPGYNAATRLTGFGNGNTCTLCIAQASDRTKCYNCIYPYPMGCREHPNELSYDRIQSANTPLKLFNAYKTRAKHLRLTYPQYLNN